MSGFDDLVKFLASAQSEQQWSLHVLEIITLMFRDQVRLILSEVCASCRFPAFLCVPSFARFLTDPRGLGERWPSSLSRGEAEGFSRTGVTEAEGAGRETFSHLPKRDEVGSTKQPKEAHAL